MKREKTDKLDRLLSYRLKKALSDDRRADWLDVRERAGMGRTLRHWSRRRALIVAGLFVLIVGACAGSTRVIPWRAAKSGWALPICKASVVKARINLVRPYYAKRSIEGIILLTNTGNSDCALVGRPKVSLLGGGSDSAHSRILTPANLFSPGRVRKPENQTALARAGSRPVEYSGVSFSWVNWCGPHYGTHGHAGKLALRLEIPNGSALVLPLYRFPDCTRPGGWSTLRFDPKGAFGAPLMEPDPPLRAEILGQKTEERLTIRIGHTFHYRVALTNTSASSFRFRRCPLYGEELYWQGAVIYGATYAPPSSDAKWYVLNCRSKPVIRAGETVIYAMEMPVDKHVLTPVRRYYRGLAKMWSPAPKDALDRVTVGNGRLVWSLALGRNHVPTAEAPVKVVP